MEREHEVDRVTQVNITKPSALDLSRIIRSQRQQPDRLVTCVYEDIRGAVLYEALDLQDDRRIVNLLSQLAVLAPETETVREVIVYTSSSKD